MGHNRILEKALHSWNGKQIAVPSDAGAAASFTVHTTSTAKATG